jgi:hypothetical protein
VFFSFHYQNDIWRVNQVRNSWVFSNESEREALGFFDGSIWERSQRTSDDSLKKLIREGIKNTSVTCILSGANTYQRRWVRYEIARSVVKGNGLLVVKIHNLKDQYGSSAAVGHNPLSFMGTYRVDDGRIFLAEFKDGEWKRYLDYTKPVTLPANWEKPVSINVLPLSIYANEYCYSFDHGYQNFSNWVHQSAVAVGV